MTALCKFTIQYKKSFTDIDKLNCFLDLRTVPLNFKVNSTGLTQELGISLRCSFKICMLLYKKSNQLFANVDANIQMIIWYLIQLLEHCQVYLGQLLCVCKSKILTVNFIKSKYRSGVPSDS